MEAQWKWLIEMIHGRLASAFGQRAYTQTIIE
jgi:hypothetical protein